MPATTILPLRVAAFVMEQHTLALVRGQENNPGGFERPAHLIARGFEHLESVFGFEALKRGK